MITEVDLSGTPCFTPDTKLTGLRTFNFIFGPNGSGKTTISNHIGTINFDSSNSEIEEVAVFNRNYIREAFRRARRRDISHWEKIVLKQRTK